MHVYDTSYIALHLQELKTSGGFLQLQFIVRKWNDFFFLSLSIIIIDDDDDVGLLLQAI